MGRKNNKRMVGDTQESRARKLAAARNSSGGANTAAPKGGQAISVAGGGTGNYEMAPNRNPASAGNGEMTWKDAPSSVNTSVNTQKPKKSLFSAGNAGNIAAAGGIIIQGVEGGMKVADWLHEQQMSPYKQDAEGWMNSAIDKEKAMEEMEERNAGIHEIFNELDELSKEDKLSESQKENARKLIKKLKSSYDSKDVSVELDEETGRITGLDKTISDRLQVEHERKIKNMESQVNTLSTASQKYTDVATNAGWGSGSIQFGGEETANEANAMKAGLDKVLRSKRKELHALREQDPAGEFNNRRRRENEVKKEEAEKRREEFRRRKMEDDFNSETDPEKKIANRRQLIEEEKTKQAELQKSIDGVKAEVDARTEANDVPGRNEAERRLLALQEKMDGSQETVHGLEQQISSVQGGGGMPGGSAPVSPAADSGVMGNPRVQELAYLDPVFSVSQENADELKRRAGRASMFGSTMKGAFSGGPLSVSGPGGGAQMDQVVKQLGEIRSQIRHLENTVERNGVF